MLDTRRFRSSYTSRDEPGKTLLGSAQKKWLLDGLQASVAPFKFVISSVPFNGGWSDDWSAYSYERDEILDFIRHAGIRGVILLVGDYHMARDSVTKTGVREFVAGPLAAFTAHDWQPQLRVADGSARTFAYVDGLNFGLLFVDPVKKVARLRFIGAKGETLFETSARANA